MVAKRSSLVVLVLLCILSASTKSVGAEYLLGPGDTVKVTIYEHPDLTTVSRVSGSGTIALPLLGEVPVAGLTTKAAEARLAEYLKMKQLVSRPRVTLNIEQYGSQWVSVLGEVNKAGKYAVEGRSTVIDMVAIAGGLNSNASDTLTVIKNSPGKISRHKINLLELFESGDMKKNAEVTNGDIIFVPRMSVFYIYGEVQHPGSYRLEKGMTVMQALSVGGGLTVRGTEKGLRIKRRNHNGETETLQVNLVDALQDNDVVYVDESMF